MILGVKSDFLHRSKRSARDTAAEPLKILAFTAFRELSTNPKLNSGSHMLGTAFLFILRRLILKPRYEESSNITPILQKNIGERNLGNSQNVLREETAERVKVRGLGRRKALETLQPGDAQPTDPNAKRLRQGGCRPPPENHRSLTLPLSPNSWSGSTRTQESSEG